MKTIGMLPCDIEVFERLSTAMGLDPDNARNFLDSGVDRTKQRELDADLVESLKHLDRAELTRLGRREMKDDSHRRARRPYGSARRPWDRLLRLFVRGKTGRPVGADSYLSLQQVIDRFLCATGDAYVLAGVHRLARLSRLDRTQAFCVSRHLGEPLSAAFMACWHAHNLDESNGALTEEVPS